MRILMASHGYPPIVSGVTLVVQKIARAMVRRGHSVTLITASDRAEPYHSEDEGVKLVRVRGVHNPLWEEAPVPFISQKGFDDVVREAQPDVLHAHEAVLLCWRLLRLKRTTGLPLLSTAYYVPRFAARHLSWNDEPQAVVESIVWAYSTWIFNQFDRVVFATAAHRNWFVEEGLDVPTAIISNGTDTVRYRPLDESDVDVEARYKLATGPRILFVSRLAKDKEIDVLIRAMPYVRARSNAHLYIVGRGDDRPRLEACIKENRLSQCVHLLGFVPESDLPALYRAVDLFAIASRCEVQSLPTLQAVATGLPVVAVDAVALPELVHDRVNGFLVPPNDPAAMADAILKITFDPDLAARMGQESLAIAQSHAETFTFDQYERLYLDLISSR